MKRKTRKIIVDGTEYQWMVEELMWPDHEVRIWCESFGKRLWCTVKFAEIGLVIRPSSVDKIIRYANEQIPTDASSATQFDWIECFR